METKTRRKRPTYSPEFRAAAMALARSGQPQEDVARVMGCTDRQIRRWLRQADIEAGIRDGKTIRERRLEKRNALLERANARLQERVHLMEEAHDFFSKGTR
jgi:transposase